MTGGSNLRPLSALFLLLLAVPMAAEDYTVTRHAGVSTGSGYADGTGPAARFAYPSGLAVAPDGNLYVADSAGNTIRMISPTGVVSTVAGLAGSGGLVNGRGAAARFNDPRAVAADGSGNLYVADTSNRAIRKISPEGAVTTLADLAPLFPLGVAVDRAGNVFVIGTGAVNPLRKITPSGSVTAIETWSSLNGSNGGIALDAAGAIFLSFSSSIRKVSQSGGEVTTVATDGGSPHDLAFDSSGNLLVVLRIGNKIVQITPAGVVTTVAGSGQYGIDDGPAASARFLFPVALALGQAGEIFVASDRSVRKIAGGVVSTLAGTSTMWGHVDGDLDTARFIAPADVVVDSTGNLFVADSDSIRRVTPAGVVSTFASIGDFSDVRGMAIDSSDTLYLSDYYTRKIFKVTSGGIVTTPAGGGTAGQDGTGSAAGFTGPEGITVDSAGTAYVVDANRVRRITPAGEVTSIAGTSTPGYEDGTGAAARFNGPRGIAAGADGNLYVADTNSRRIRRVTPEGVVTTFAGNLTAGTADGIGAAATFISPYEIEMDDDGVLWVMDGGRLRKITADAQVTTVAGRSSDGNVEGTGSNARFSYLTASYLCGLGSDGEGNVYVADSDARNIRRVRLPGIDDVATVTNATPPINTEVALSTDADAAETWTWSIVRRPAGSVAELSSTSTESLTFTPDVADLFTILLRAEGPEGLRFSTVDITPASTCEPLASVVAELDGTSTICSTGTSSSIASAVITGGGAVTYQWSWRLTPTDYDHPIGGATSADYTLHGPDFEGVGTKYLVVTVTSSCGVPVASNPLAVTVVAPGESPVISASSGVPANGTSNFASVDDAVAGATYAWTVTNGAIVSGQGTRTIRYSAGATGHVTLGVTVTTVCAVSAEVQVPIVAQPAGASMLYLVTPCRVIDTRGNPIADGSTRTLTIGGSCGVPVGAKAIALNVTAIAPAASGFAALYPSNVAWPGSSTINYRAGRTRANNAIVAVAPDGTINLRNVGASTDFLIDVTGYFQ